MDKKENWNPFHKDELAFRKKQKMSMALGIYRCFDIKRNITIRSDGSINNCGFGVLPAQYLPDGSQPANFKKISEAFVRNGGPLGVARYQGMKEKKIYETLMNKGPCGLCYTAMKMDER